MDTKVELFSELSVLYCMVQSRHMQLIKGDSPPPQHIQTNQTP
jgi:hypothetical protein